jgi:hypothetical protein
MLFRYLIAGELDNLTWRHESERQKYIHAGVQEDASHLTLAVCRQSQATLYSTPYISPRNISLRDDLHRLYILDKIEYR